MIIAEEESAYIFDYLSNPNILLMKGAALFPNITPPMRVIRAGRSTALRILAGLVLSCWGSQQYNVLLPLDEPPVYLPNGSSVIAAGCLNDKGYFFGEELIILEEKGTSIINANSNFCLP